VLKVGDELGRYEIIAHLKSGGMATLYLGRRRIPPDNRIFAIKVVHPHYLDDEDLVAMFEDEARLSLRIHHPNVVHVEEVGEAEGVHYLAMEYVHGCSVAQLLQALIRRRRRMSPELAVYIAMQVCEGLHAAHSLLGDHGEPLNVVHRDVSPQNILLAHTGELRLIDFGIAKSRARMHHSATGSSIRGKLRYMSPEHAKGRNVDRRTDIYALGIVLWEMLTMRPLFWGETDFDVLTKVQDPIIDPPSAYAPNTSPALDDAVLAALAPDRETRPESALAFRDLLSEAVPIAEALDDEQIAELLHAVLGEEMIRVADRMPAFVSMELRFSSTGTTTNPERPHLEEGALESLTGPTDYDPEIVQTFVGEPQIPSGIDELLGAASIELMEEETSTTISAVALVDYLEKTAGRAKAMRLAAKAEQPERNVGAIAAGANAIPGPEDPTDQLSHTALAEIHLDLKKRRVQQQESPQPLIDDDEVDEDVDTVTFDEGIPALSNTEIEVSALELDSAEIDIIGDIVDGYGGGGFDDPEEDTTLKGGIPVKNIPPPKDLGNVSQGASWRGVDPGVLGATEPKDEEISASPNDSWPESQPPSEPPTVPDGDISMTEVLPETRESARPEGDSEPPTEVWDQPPEFALPEPNDGFGAGDRAALMAGIAVAILLLVGLAGYLLL
jgi:serine/threonine-protein kinase